MIYKLLVLLGEVVMGIKQENEITVKALCEPDELCEILKNKGFNVVDKFTMNDIFMLPNSMKSKLKDLTSREILKNAILIRDSDNKFYGTRNKTIIFKKKEFDNDGNILNQQSIKCSINNIDEAVNLFKSLNYYIIMNIVENSIVYGKDGLEIYVKDIQDGLHLIEVETVSNNKKIDTIEKLKKEIINLQLPLDTTNFFVKKAEIELDKIIKR